MLRPSLARCQPTDCKQWIKAGEPHDCWTTTEAALTADLSEDLRDAWERLRETAAFGDQRIYASHKSIMFSRRPPGDITKRMSCYFFAAQALLLGALRVPRAGLQAGQPARIKPY